MLNNILVIEDDGSNLKLLNRFLTKRGYVISTAMSAEEGYNIIATKLPDILLVDLKLPGMSGLELTALLRHNHQTKHIIIIAVTAFEGTFDEKDAKQAGCDCYIVKPIDFIKLSNKLHQFLNK